VGREQALQMMQKHSPAVRDMAGYFRAEPKKISAGSIWPFLRERYGIDISRPELKRRDPKQVKQSRTGGQGADERARQQGEALESTLPPEPKATGIEAALEAIGSGWVTDPETGARVRTGLAVGDLSDRLAKLGDRLGFDELNQTPAIDGVALTASEIELLYVRLSEAGWKVNKACAIDALMRAARRHPFHPVQQYLEGVGAAVPPLPMEQWNRLDQHLLGIEDPIAAEFLPQYLISAAARVFRPGCGVRRSPVFIGPQHRGKTALGRIMFGAEWWVEGLQGSTDRDMRTRCHRGFGVELSELNGITKRSDQESLKAFLTERTDILRRAYGRTEEVLHRRFVFWGTSNGPPLRDLSGSTRFVCIPLTDRMLPLDWAVEHRDAIWSRAVEQYRQIPAGAEPWDTPSEACRLAVAERNANHQEIDPWAEGIEKVLRRRVEENDLPVKLPELLEAMEVPRERQSNSAGARVRAIAESLGWVWQQRWIDRKTGIKAKGLWPPLAPTGPHRAPTGPPPADPCAGERSGPVAPMAPTESERSGETGGHGTTGQQQRSDSQSVGASGGGRWGAPPDSSGDAGSESHLRAVPVGATGGGQADNEGFSQAQQRTEPEVLLCELFADPPPAQVAPPWLPELERLAAAHPDQPAPWLAQQLDPSGTGRPEGRDVLPWLKRLRARAGADQEAAA
jgi:hypothetical protein